MDGEEGRGSALFTALDVLVGFCYRCCWTQVLDHCSVELVDARLPCGRQRMVQNRVVNLDNEGVRTAIVVR